MGFLLNDIWYCVNLLLFVNDNFIFLFGERIDNLLVIEGKEVVNRRSKNMCIKYLIKVVNLMLVLSNSEFL